MVNRAPPQPTTRHISQKSLSNLLRLIPYTARFNSYHNQASAQGAEKTTPSLSPAREEHSTPYHFPSASTPSDIGLRSPVVSSVQMDLHAPLKAPPPPERDSRLQLLKKTRKLSRVFTAGLGVPSLIPENGSMTSVTSPTTSLPTSPLSGKRKMSVGKGFLRIASIPDISRVARRARSFTSPPAVSPRSPLSPVAPSTPTTPSHPLARHSMSSTTASHAERLPSDMTDAKRMSLDISRKSSVSADSRPSSFILSPRQIRRASLAKLSRHLGENIPPDMVPLSPQDPTASCSKTSLHCSVVEGSHVSVDAPSPDRVAATTAVERPVSALKRSHSLWTGSSSKEGSAASDEDFQKRYQSNFGSEEEIRERQRAIKVKRARKMSKV
ncbi:hypothetical protein HGRIS_007728 [Hohenbuehelia grisea]|uniref:Uncharacterized protein n=1 Tax=Hohenbuehelia grisea TaxID=104357 RepID=A0ABR3J6I6_9AGAR